MDKWDIPQFQFRTLSRNMVRNEWIKYKRNFDFIVAATGETDKARIRNVFLAKGGPDLQEVFASIPGADVQNDDEAGIDCYAVAIAKLDAYFAPKQHDTFERNLFWTLKPNPDETLVKFMLRCQEQSNKCDFGKSAEESRSISVIDKVILFAPSDLKEQLLQKDSLNIDEVTKMVSSYESVKHQARTIGSSGGVSENMAGLQSTSGVNRIRPDARECTRCGRKGHYANDKNCSARNKECNKCKRIGHFANQCRTAVSLKRKFEDSNIGNKRLKPERVSEIRNNNENQGDVKDRSFIFNISDGDELLWMKVEGVLLQLMVDSGCKRNIIDEKSWNYLKTNGIKTWNQKKECDEVFLPYGEDAKPLTVLGSFETTVGVEDAGKVTETVNNILYY
ncbi:uncharacterized protein LOC134290880 [Aedes albopictus]|uniref:CCHC-type domain-containing protein n=1 Tax=Aedes albopictus TaxID=7160 RepID=A0ABM1ZZJ8_AEDAL